MIERQSERNTRGVVPGSRIELDEAAFEALKKTGRENMAETRLGKLSGICDEMFALVPAIAGAQDAAHQWIDAKGVAKTGDSDEILTICGMIGEACTLLASLRKSEIAAEKKMQRELDLGG